MRKTLIVIISVLVAFVANLTAQETPPAPSAPKAVLVPAVQIRKLPNGLTVAVVEKRAVPLVTIRMLIKSGASAEADEKAGLADLTASMLTKGTKSRTATQIAEDVEFLGGTINSGAGWNSSFVSITVTSDKVDQAMAILADVVLNPKFDEKELDLLKSQTLDGLAYNLKQPSFLANYVASKYSFAEHPANGTPESIKSITQLDVAGFHKNDFRPGNAVLIFTGDISAEAADKASAAGFADWRSPSSQSGRDSLTSGVPEGPAVRRMLVIDLPKSGQAAVNYAIPMPNIGRMSASYYRALVLNSVLGGGYSSRLNYEIRIKRGLSYGAGSSFAWRREQANFGTRTQTKNESAAEVAELVVNELKKLAETSVSIEELIPRKSVLTGNFDRNLETTAGLSGALADLFTFGDSTSELNSFVNDVNLVTDKEIKEFAKTNLLGGDIIIVGDYSVFKDDLAKRFPGITVDVIKADNLDLSKDNLRK